MIDKLLLSPDALPEGNSLLRLGISPEQLYTIEGGIEGITQDRMLHYFLSTLHENDVNPVVLDSTNNRIMPLILAFSENQMPHEIDNRYGKHRLKYNPILFPNQYLASSFGLLSQAGGFPTDWANFAPLYLYGVANSPKPVSFALLENIFPLEKREMDSNIARAALERLNAQENGDVSRLQLTRKKVSSTGNSIADGRKIYNTLRKLTESSQTVSLHFDHKTGNCYLYLSQPTEISSSDLDPIVGFCFEPVVKKQRGEKAEESRSIHGNILPIFASPPQ